MRGVDGTEDDAEVVFGRLKARVAREVTRGELTLALVTTIDASFLDHS